MINLNSIPQVAYAQMNQVHDEEATFLNNLEQTLQDESDNHDKILSILNELLGHTR